MKRSEIVDIIEDYLSAFDSNFDSTTDTASNILKDLEEAGMLPPPDEHFWKAFTPSYFKWEPEDEKK